MTLRLSPIVTSEVECPIVTFPPELVVDIFKSPVELLINELLPSCFNIKSPLVPNWIESLSFILIVEALSLPVTATSLLLAELLPVIVIIVSLNEFLELWSLANLKLPYWDTNW